MGKRIDTAIKLLLNGRTVNYLVEHIFFLLKYLDGVGHKLIKLISSCPTLCVPLAPLDAFASETSKSQNSNTSLILFIGWSISHNGKLFSQLGKLSGK